MTLKIHTSKRWLPELFYAVAYNAAVIQFVNVFNFFYCGEDVLQ